MIVIIILLGRGDTESHFVRPYCLLVCLDLTEMVLVFHATLRPHLTVSAITLTEPP